MTYSLTFDAVSEAVPGPKWLVRWQRSWPAYDAWVDSRGGADVPPRDECENALARYMPELMPVHARLTDLAGGTDLAARFLSTWCPPRYLGGCSVAAHANSDAVRLIRNYDLAPDLNEGLLLRTEWSGMPVMGMIEFLWGLSDGINAEGLCAALAYGGRSDVARGFGVTTIMRYVLETCATVPEALAALRRVPSHMAYNIVLADRRGTTVTAELSPGGGIRTVRPAIATNHQHGAKRPDRPFFTQTSQRREHLKQIIANGVSPDSLANAFLQSPLYQRNYAQGFGTLFTAVYDINRCEVSLRWPDTKLVQQIHRFDECQRVVAYDSEYVEDIDWVWEEFDPETFIAAISQFTPPEIAEAFKRKGVGQKAAAPDWLAFGQAFANYYSQANFGSQRNLFR